MNQMIPSSEKVARILNPEWIQDGVLMHEAYHLRVGETYISVNRPSVSSYDNDVSDFVRNHPSFSYEGDKYKRSLLGVDDIRNINVVFEGIEAHVNVEVEPRDVHYKSHAGIFTRFENKNIKNGQLVDVHAEKMVSADSVLLEVRMSLLEISSLEECKLSD